MILLDPDLDPDPVRTTLRAKDVSVSSTRGAPRRDALPSKRTLARFLSDAQAAVRMRGRVSVLLTTDKTIRRLNREFRGIDKPTDVLSFPAHPHPGPEAVAGDLAISVPKARLQGAARGHSLANELKVLILHGLLHLAGYDHETDAGQMARRERVLRAKLRLPEGLIERVEQTGMPGSRRKRRKPEGRRATTDRSRRKG
jgi:probable rRNA maturation factor